MKQQFSILGLGSKIESIRPTVEHSLQRAPLQPNLVFAPQAPVESWVQQVIEHRPQILLISAEGPELNLGDLPNYIKGIDQKYRPEIFLFLENASSFFAQQIAQKNPFYFKQIDPIQLDSIQQFALLEEQEDDYLAIEPNPEFELSPTGKIRPVGNLPANAFDSISWKGEKFTLPEFFELTAYLREEETRIPLSNSLFLYDHQAFLRSRFHIKELEKFLLDGVIIRHIKEIEDQNSENAHVFQLKLTDTIVEQSVFFQIQALFSSPAWLKQHIPVKIKTEHTVLRLYTEYFLSTQNLQIADTSRAVELDLTRGSHTVTWPSELWAIPFFDDLKNQNLEFDLPPESTLSWQALSQSREILFRRKEHLTERQKAYEGAKLLRAQEEDIKIMAQRKLELLGQLMSRAETYVPDSDEMILKLGQDCLVFYEDEVIARQISRHLQGSGKNLFFDIGGFSNLKSLLTYKTDHLVPFLSHGHILVTEKSRSFLIKKLDRIAEESRNQAPAPVDLTAQELSVERDTLQGAFENLACLEAWNLCEPVLTPLAENLVGQLAETAKDRIRLTYAGVDHDVAILTHSWYNLSRIQKAFDSMQTQGIVARPDIVAYSAPDAPMATQQTDLQVDQENSERIDRFISKIAEQIKEMDTDLVMINQDLPLSRLLAQRFSAFPELQDRSFILLLEEAPSLEDLSSLLQLNCLPLYFGRHTNQLGQNWQLQFR